MSYGLILAVIGGFFFLLFVLVLVLAAMTRRRDLSDDYYCPDMPDAKHPTLPPMPTLGDAPVKVSAVKPRLEEPAPEPPRPVEPEPDTPILKPSPAPAPDSAEKTETPQKPRTIEPLPDTPILKPTPDRSRPAPRPWAPGRVADQKRPRPPEPEEPLYEVKPRRPKQETVKTRETDEDTAFRYAEIPDGVLNSSAREMASAGINYDISKRILEIFCRIDSTHEIPPPMLQAFERVGMTREVMAEFLTIARAAREGSAFNFSKLQTLKPQTGFAVYRSMQKVINAMRDDA